LNDVDRRLQPLDKSLEPADEAGSTLSLTGDRPLEIEILDQHAGHPVLIE